jgi:hypothetical protein
MLPVMDVVRAEGRKRVCVDFESPIPLSESIFRTFVVGPDENYIQLECQKSAVASRTFESMGDSGELALIVEGEVVSTYHYLDKHAVRQSCGLIPTSDLNVAMDICEAVVGRLSGDAKPCAQICDLKETSDLADVCFVANAEAPPAKTPPR